MNIVIAVGIAYLFGSISSAIIICKLMRLPDPRNEGSRNPGATNVLRLGGKKAAIITLFFDMLKGLGPVLGAKWCGLHPNGLALVAFAAFLGHLFPIFFRFEGGKGVATALGGLIALSFPAGLAWIATWWLIALMSRYVSLASLGASFFAPVYIWFFTVNSSYTFTVALMSSLLIYRHRTNIVKLFSGNEHKIGRKKKVIL